MRFKSEAQRKLVMRLLSSNLFKKSSKLSILPTKNKKFDDLYNFAKKLNKKIQNNISLQKSSLNLKINFEKIWKKSEGKNMFNAPGVKPGKQFKDMTKKELEITKSHKSRLIKNTKYAIKKGNETMFKLQKILLKEGKEAINITFVTRVERFIDIFERKLKNLEKL